MPDAAAAAQQHYVDGTEPLRRIAQAIEQRYHALLGRVSYVRRGEALLGRRAEDLGQVVDVLHLLKQVYHLVAVAEAEVRRLALVRERGERTEDRTRSMRYPVIGELPSAADGWGDEPFESVPAGFGRRNGSGRDDLVCARGTSSCPLPVEHNYSRSDAI